ncbi:MAG TPA: c-type cytochrome domain-containing protein [Candidatus Acidoferrum sp.]|nr:c-type cytochrome domain-containing protein [Candidatus Acidoferrum sp.]
MNSRSRIILCSVGLFVVLLLLVAALQAPPDGIERGDFSQFVGRFHPLAVHLPIALVLLVALLECAGLFQSRKHLQAGAGFVLGLATASAVAAAFLGWMLGRSGGYEGALVTRHMWGGISLAAALIVCCSIRAWNTKLYGAALFATVCLLAWTSDQGGRLTHGDGFLTEHMPGSLRSVLGVAPVTKRRVAVNSSTLTPTSPTTASGAVASTPASVAFFTSRVEPIFDDKCVQCHGPQKKKGKLRLDTFDYVMQGGKDGAIVKPGDLKNSELYRRITLPRDNKDAMPAEGKPGLTAAELKVIEFWIASGATESVTAAKVKAAAVPPEPVKLVVPALAPDYRPRSAEIAALQSKLGVQLVLRSQDPQDGLILRTVSAPERCNDEALRALKPIADLVVDAELARTEVTDEGLRTLASFPNLRHVDLSYTAVTSRGLAPLATLAKLETLNLTATTVDDQGVLPFRHKKGLQHLYLFGTKVTQPEVSDTK